MAEPICSVDPEQVEYTYKHHRTGETVEVFREEEALAAMLLNEVVFLNTPWYREDLSEEDKSYARFLVVCNDIFAWGCADAEPLPHDEVQNLWRMWRKDPAWGAEVWCIQRRKEMPQPPVEKLLRAAGYDLNAMGLKTNETDAKVAAIFDEMRGGPPAPPKAST